LPAYDGKHIGNSCLRKSSWQAQKVGANYAVINWCGACLWLSALHGCEGLDACFATASAVCAVVLCNKAACLQALNVLNADDVSLLAMPLT
jgi:1-deoxy-D-xylulose 5-phosphate reductoisomerase